MIQLSAAIATVVVILLSILFIIRSAIRRINQVPGLPSSHPKFGNTDEIADAGSVHEFLVDLHARFGDIASFWVGKMKVVSIASPQLFREHAHAFDRPASIYFTFLEPIFAKHSLQTATGSQGRDRFHMYASVYSRYNMHNYLNIFTQSAAEVVERLSNLQDGENARLMDLVFGFALKGVTRATLGEDISDESIFKLHHSYDICWSEIDAIMAGDIKARDINHTLRFSNEVNKIQAIFDEAMTSRRAHPPPDGARLLIDVMIANNVEKDVYFPDLLTFIVAGFHTIFNCLLWTFYHLSNHPEVEERVLRELKEVISDEELELPNIQELKYTRQVIDEVLRYCAITSTAARCQGTDIKLGGYTVPSNTPVIHALGAVMMDPNTWKDPERFDPENFSPENVSSLPELSFVPFGFAGGRKCPCRHLAYLEITIFLASILPKYRLHMIEGQKLVPRYGFVTRPSEEMWVTVNRRK